MKSWKPAILSALLILSLVLAGCKVIESETATAESTTDPKTAEIETAVATAIEEAAPVETAVASGGSEAYPAGEATAEVVAAGGEPSGYPSQLPDGALFALVLADGSAVYPTVTDMTALAVVEITADGQTKSGALLRDLLALYGVTQYQSITVDGSTYSAQLGFEQVNDQVILELNADSASVNLIAAWLTAGEWVQMVSKITVQ